MICNIDGKTPDIGQSLAALTPGESMVWQCGGIACFETVILPAILRHNDKLPITYFYFSQENPFLFSGRHAAIHVLNPEDSFESFTFQVFELIEASPAGTLFVFDCLSELQTTWSSDMMIANFFRIIIPILRDAGSCGVFPIINGKHSHSAIRSILKTTAVFMNVEKQDNTILIKPFSRHNLPQERTWDIWKRYFAALRSLSRDEPLSAGLHARVCRRLMTGEPEMERMIVRHFALEDYFSIYDRMIGTGRIGGKACGYYLGRKLISTYLPDAAGELEPHDTYHIGTDVFYTYMVENDCWRLRLKFRREKDQFRELKPFREALTHGTFPAFIRKYFLRMLIHYGSTPIIVRSSSFMEDGYGNAFSGKYESVFCSNQGTLKERLYEFENAVRKVYASTLSQAALDYRNKWNLLGQDEQMALLVQKVSGTRYGDLFFPIASGVSFSYNPYRWMEHINPEAGMARMVAGLGTRAVNRTPGDYPRLVGLDRPQAMFWPTIAERHKYSQRYMDVLNLTTRTVESKRFEDILTLLPPGLCKYIFSHDTDAESMLMERGCYRHVFFTDCQGIVDNTRFISLLKEVLYMLEQQYQRPVDIEFALTIRDDKTIGFDLLQCRPLQHRKTGSVAIREHNKSEVLFDITKASMRSSKQEPLDLIVVVDPKEYYETPHAEKSSIAAAIGEINQQIGDRKAMLLVPGRIGTSSPELGVPVSYTEVNQFKAICEVSYHAVGYDPELSYGSHMFQDMVEADVFYGAIHENSSTRLYQPALLRSCPNIYGQLLPARSEYSHVIRVCDLSAKDAALYLDAVRGHAVCIITDHTAADGETNTPVDITV